MIFEPELGQMVSSKAFGEYECPQFFITLLGAISDEIDRITSNKNGRGINPANNEASEYINGTFEMRSYYWGECSRHETFDISCEICQKEEAPNFKYKDLEVRWYKYLGRGTSCNKIINAQEGVDIFTDCMKSLETEEIVR